MHKYVSSNTARNTQYVAARVEEREAQAARSAKKSIATAAVDYNMSNISFESILFVELILRNLTVGRRNYNYPTRDESVKFAGFVPNGQ